MAVRWQEVKVGQPSEPYYLKPLKYIAWIFCSMNIIMKHFDVSLLSGNWIQMESFDHLVEYSNWSKVIHAWSLISSVGEAYFYKIQAILFLNICVGPTILRWLFYFYIKSSTIEVSGLSFVDYHWPVLKSLHSWTSIEAFSILDFELFIFAL